MDRGDRTSLESWIEYKEYEASRSEIEDDDSWLGGDSGYIGSSSYRDEYIRRVRDSTDRYRQKTRYQAVAFGRAEEKKCDMDVLAELIVGDEKDVCQLAIDLYDWAEADKEKYEPKEVTITDDSWNWMKVVYECEQDYERQYRAMLFDKCSWPPWLPIKALKYTAITDENAYSQTIIGELFHYGTKEPRGQWKAFSWYKKAAVLGYAEAQYRLGNCYYYEEGIVKNEKKAVEWWQKAAKQNHGKAMERLGYLHLLNGKYKLAMLWLTRAGEEELPLAQAWLGIMYEHGLGVKKSREEASTWFKRAGHNGLPEAQVWMEQHSERESASYWRGLAVTQRTKNEGRHKSLRSIRDSYRKTIAESIIMYVRSQCDEEDIQKLGKRGTIASWKILLGIAVLIALFIKGCM